MGYFAFGGDGPRFILRLGEAKKLNEKGFMNFRNDNLHARISVVKHNPNLRKFPNGFYDSIDKSCNMGIRLRRFPEDICPYAFVGSQFYVLRIQRSLFEKIINQSETSNDKTGCIHSRCKYDSFALVITDI